MNPAKKKAIELATELLDFQWEKIAEEISNRHVSGDDMTFGITFKMACRTPDKMTASLRYSTPHVLEVSGQIEDPNQPGLFDDEEGSDE
jgi:hypothetical protein